MPSPTQLFRANCDFMWGAATVDAIPPAQLPEVAFAGRSNVGKSSLLNALTKRKSLARTSKNPGCTQQINFYRLGDELTLADIPGYGFAKVSKQERKGWDILIRSYLCGRPNLRRVFLLVDGRHGVKAIDEEIMEALDEAAVSYQVIFTKADKQKPSELQKMIENIVILGKKHTALHPQAIVTSSVDATGLDEVRREIAEIVAQ